MERWERRILVPAFETKAADMIGLYAHAAVFCVDERHHTRISRRSTSPSRTKRRTGEFVLMISLMRVCWNAAVAEWRIMRSNARFSAINTTLI